MLWWVVPVLFSMAAIPLTFADVTVLTGEGTSIPGCEVTNDCFVPNIVTIDVGEKVVWKNVDVTDHMVTSGVLADGGPDGIFDSGWFGPSHEFSYTFDTPGEYPYFCIVHPWRTGMVVVQAAEPVSSYADTIVVMQTWQGPLVIELFPDDAPNHVANFVELASSGFYEGTVFHRIISGFMIQGGDPHTKPGSGVGQDRWGTGGLGTTVDAEFNDIMHNRGIVSMARGSNPNSAGSQFFIVHQNSEHLDESYTVFGRLATAESYDTLDAIADARVDDSYRPAQPYAVRIIFAEVLTRDQVPNLLDMNPPRRIHTDTDFVSEEHNFSIKFPEGWVIQELGGEGQPDLAVVGTSGAALPPSIAAYIDELGDHTLNSVRDSKLADLENLLTGDADFQITNHELATISGFDAFVLDAQDIFDPGIGPLEIGYREVTIVSSGKIYTFLFSSVPGDFESGVRSFVKSLESFKVLNEAPKVTVRGERVSIDGLTITLPPGWEVQNENAFTAIGHSEGGIPMVMTIHSTDTFDVSILSTISVDIFGFENIRILQSERTTINGMPAWIVDALNDDFGKLQMAFVISGDAVYAIAFVTTEEAFDENISLFEDSLRTIAADDGSLRAVTNLLLINLWWDITDDVVAEYGTSTPMYNVVSGSMKPSIKTGDKVMISEFYEFEDIDVGDVIMYKRPSDHERNIVHRVVEVLDHTPYTLRTKGDANPSSILGTDYPVTKQDYIGRVIGVVPYYDGTIHNDGDVFLGPANAPLKLVLFTDALCHACRQFHIEVLPLLKEQYVDNLEVVQLTYRDFPVTDGGAYATAMAECAGRQGKYWEFYDLLMLNGVSQSLAQLDLSGCQNQGHYMQGVLDDRADGIRYGVVDAPTLFIGNDHTGYHMISGDMSYLDIQIIMLSVLFMQNTSQITE